MGGLQSTGTVNQRVDFVVVKNTENDQTEQVLFEAVNSRIPKPLHSPFKNYNQFSDPHNSSEEGERSRTAWNVVDYDKYNNMVDDPFKDIPLEYRIPLSELLEIHKSSIGSGNFARKVTEKLFPELYGPDAQRLNYSYFGGGRLNKIELDQIRKAYLKRYVTFFHPELNNYDLWKLNAITKINESLRRPIIHAKYKPATKMTDSSHL